MAVPLSYRMRCRDAEDERPVSAEEAAGLHTLSQRAVRLRGALRTARDESALRDAVAAYVAGAAARGISLQRTRDAIELFVHEHAPRHRSTDGFLDLVLRLASAAHAASTRHPREAL